MTELTIVRVFDAPRFQAWTDPAHLAAWFGPHGFVASETSTDPRPGGAWHSRITPGNYTAGSRRRLDGAV
ncbi:SRPBCC domain-containing protein [Amycolatopsis echigonensis]|uniref:SRPBCC domain-containing protein n=1 Tax=Amycolatopsis echigonensis TaxID=2576905 RepID=UPI001FECA4CE|nr:SRPBCC domain-containing protein [Amycolatopsis echigonensis]